MSLTPADQTRLARILRLAQQIELAWPSTKAARDLSADVDYLAIKKEIAAFADRRLAESVTHFHDQISLTHFYAFIVPFERLAGRALRDDQFLVEEGDNLHKAVARLPLKLIVENVRSAFNVGALFRTSECLGVSEIMLCGYTPDPTDEKTARTAMGTSALVPWRRGDRATTACRELRAEGYTLVALETAARATSLHSFAFSEKVAFVLGNERFGIEAETLRAVDAICRIPVRGSKNSMNVGVAFGIAAFEWLRQFAASGR